MKNKLLAIIFSILAFPTLMLAQENPPSFEGESPYGVTDVQVPIDDWVFVLVAGAIVYGLFRAKSHKRLKAVLK